MSDLVTSLACPSMTLLGGAVKFVAIMPILTIGNKLTLLMWVSVTETMNSWPNANDSPNSLVKLDSQ